MQLGSSGDPVGAGQVDIDHGHIRALGQRGRHDGLAIGDLGDHLDIVFEVQQRDQRVAQDPHVLGHQNPYHIHSRAERRAAPEHRPYRTCRYPELL